MKRSPGEGNGNSLQYPCLENLMDRGAWGSSVHGVAKSWARLTDWHLLTYLQDIEYNSLYYTVGPCCLSVLFIYLFIYFVCQWDQKNLDSGLIHTAISSLSLSPFVCLSFSSPSVASFACPLSQTHGHGFPPGAEPVRKQVFPGPPGKLLHAARPWDLPARWFCH